MDANELAALRLNPAQEATLYPSRMKWILIILFFSLGVVIGPIMAIKDHDPMGWVVFFVCDAFVAFALFHLASGRNYLRLTRAGLSVRTTFNQYDVPWNNIGDVGVILFRRNVMVAFNYRQVPPEKEKRASQNRRFTNYEELVPETYGLDAEELAKLIAARRDASS